MANSTPQKRRIALKQMLSYPCADMQQYAEQRLKEEFGQTRIPQDSETDWDKIIPQKGFPFSVGYDIDFRR
jgi:hypothetical protein